MHKQAPGLPRRRLSRQQGPPASPAQSVLGGCGCFQGTQINQAWQDIDVRGERVDIDPCIELLCRPVQETRRPVPAVVGRSLDAALEFVLEFCSE